MLWRRWNSFLCVCVCVLENHSPAVELLRVLFSHQMEAMGNGSVLKKKRRISVIGLRYKILHIKCVLTASKNLKPPGLTCSTALDQVVGENWLTYLVEYVWNTFFFSNSDVHLFGQSDAFTKKTSPWKKNIFASDRNYNKHYSRAKTLTSLISI